MASSAPVTGHRFIDHADGLAAVGDALRTAPWVCLDSESNSMHVYLEQVCLLQINAGGNIFVVDPLALGVVAGRVPSSVLEPLRAGLERTDRPLYLHGGEYDAACLRRDFGITLGGVFDTQQAASLLGWPKTGYGSIVENLCGVVLGKEWTTYDWATRPLDPAALAYAVDDVVYLPRVAETLSAAVTAAGIDDEVREANAVVAASAWNGGFGPDGMWRMKGLEGAPPDALRIVSRLYRWRDAAAKAENVPPGRMVNNEVLLLIARHRPTSLAELKKSRLKSAILDRYGAGLLEAIVLAKDDPVPVAEEPAPWSRAVQACEQRLKVWRREEAERRAKIDGRAIPLNLVLPPRALEHLAVHGAADLEVVPQLGARRRERYGKVLAELCAGVR